MTNYDFVKYLIAFLKITFFKNTHDPNSMCEYKFKPQVKAS
jgi:hypothetical protein